jgi:hypothetical protein
VPEDLHSCACPAHVDGFQVHGSSCWTLWSWVACNSIAQLAALCISNTHHHLGCTLLTLTHYQTSPQRVHFLITQMQVGAMITHELCLLLLVNCSDVNLETSRQVAPPALCHCCCKYNLGNQLTSPAPCCSLFCINLNLSSSPASCPLLLLQ